MVVGAVVETAVSGLVWPSAVTTSVGSVDCSTMIVLWAVALAAAVDGSVLSTMVVSSAMEAMVAMVDSMVVAASMAASVWTMVGLEVDTFDAGEAEDTPVVGTV